MKLPVRTLLDDSDLMVKKSFPLDKSNEKAVLLLRLSLRVRVCFNIHCNDFSKLVVSVAEN